MCVQAHCTIDWLPFVDPVEDWPWIGPQGVSQEWSGNDIYTVVQYSTLF